MAGSSSAPVVEVTDTCEDPPTFIRLNKFTSAFQALIDSYGISTYQEVNPMPFTVITFPFLFSVMFGDIGDGLLLLAFALLMIVKEKYILEEKNLPEVMKIFFSGRYIILLMGIFSIYTGIIYNDIFGKPIFVYESHWHADHTRAEVEDDSFKIISFGPANFLGNPYAFGVDPMWKVADNRITFMNSFKMKSSVILGVSQMVFGVLLSLWNHLYFHHYVNIYALFVPQLLLLFSPFVWLCAMIFIKWFTYGATKDELHLPKCAPSVLMMFTDLPLFRAQRTNQTVCGLTMFPYQRIVNDVLAAVFLTCTLLLLVIKPLYLLDLRAKKQRQSLWSLSAAEKQQSKEGEEDLGMDEVLIHQAILTIEFVLGTVSHTASYLRLWALSLAHSQLSEVLWSMLFGKLMNNREIGYFNSLLVFLVFGLWALVTLAILLIMEGLSAFLHTLRLHWVEFQSKFYSGLGYPFQPFSFKTLVDKMEEDQH